jgi:hypothetical protein
MNTSSDEARPTPNAAPGLPGAESQPAARPQPKRRKHLIDPSAPRPVASAAAAERSLTRVQRWVASSLAVTTILHMSIGLVLAAMFVPENRLDSQIGLNVIAAAFGVMAVAVALVIHGRKLLSPWLLLGILPGIAGLWLTLGWVRQQHARINSPGHE